MSDFDLSMAITADGDQAVAELNAVDAAQDKVRQGQAGLDGQSRKTAQSAKELAAQQKATAEAINQVTRATNPAVGSQRALEAALRSAERAYLAGKISAGAFARAQEIAGRASFASATNMRQAQQGARQLGLQFNDLGTQVASGISPMVALTQQAGQVGFAMSQMGGKIGAVGSFIAGGWGALILIGASFLGQFISKMVEGGDASDKLKGALDIQRMSLAELTDAIDKSNEAQKKANQTTAESEIAALNDAEARRKRAIQIREETVALLEQAKAAAAGANLPGIGGVAGTGTTIQGIADTRVTSLQQQLDAANAALARAQQGVALATVPIARRRAQEATDPAAKIRGDYDRAVAKATEEFTKHGQNVAKYNAALEAAEREQKRRTDELQKANRTSRTTTDKGPPVTPAEVSRLLKDAFGGTITSTTGGKHVANSFHYQAQAVDFVPRGGVGALTKAQIKEAAAAAGVKVLELLGPGDKDHSDHFHVAFSKQRLNGDQIAQTGQTLADQRAREAEKAQRDLQQLAAFGEQAAQQIAALSNRAMNTGAVQQANAQLAQLDKVMKEVEQRKPPNLAELRTNAAAARKDIQDGIVKPFDDYIASQNQALQVEALRLAGLETEAETLAEVNRQEAIRGKELLPEEIRKIYEAVEARRAMTLEIQENQKAQRDYLRDLDQYKDVFRSLFSGNSKDITSFPKRLFDVFKQQAGDKLFDQVFGGIFKQLEGEATGANKVKASNVKLAASADRATKAILQMANAAGQAAGSVGAQGDTGEQVADGLEKSPLGGILGKLGKGIGLSDQTIANIGGIVNKGMQGAATGAVVNSFMKPLGKALGFKTSSTGAQIGGAIGSFIPIPGGDIIGAAIGSIVGGLFKKTKKASATISAVDGQVNVGDAVGRGSSQKQAASALAGAVGSAIGQIADALGGSIGAFKVSIGVDKKGRFAVDPTGSGRTKGVQTFKTEQEAIAFAIMDAIRDGAVMGLSAAVQKALASSPDIDKGLREALKVRDLETLLKGLTGQLDKVFEDFETQARDRVRIAKAYGLDLLKTEELNAKQRAEVLTQVTQQRIGDLKAFLDDLKFGDLAEGTAADKRNALLTQVADVRQKAIDGVEGAASQLAQLERQLVSMSREMFGTAGPEYANDRAAAQADAERIIAEETARAREAQERATAYLNAATTQNQLTNETNDLLVQANNYLAAIAAGGTGGSAGGGNVERGFGGRATNLV